MGKSTRSCRRTCQALTKKTQESIILSVSSLLEQPQQPQRVGSANRLYEVP